MITITTLTNSFILNGAQYPKGSLVVTPTSEGVKIGHVYADFSKTTVDGQTYVTAQSLYQALDTKLFKSGGGAPGEGVQDQSSTPSNISFPNQ